MNDIEKATKIFEKHWTKATGNPLDETTKHHMKYAIEAINEALFLGDISDSKTETGIVEGGVAKFNGSCRTEKCVYNVSRICKCTDVDGKFCKSRSV